MDEGPRTTQNLQAKMTSGAHSPPRGSGVNGALRVPGASVMPVTGHERLKHRRNKLLTSAPVSRGHLLGGPRASTVASRPGALGDVLSGCLK